MLKSAPAIGAGPRTGLNLDEGRVRGPKTEPRIWHPKSVPPLLPASVSVPPKGPKNGAAKPPTQPWCAKCPGLTDPHLVAYPCVAAIAAATGQPIDWPTFQPILAEAQSRSIGGSRQLRLFSASAPFSCCSSMHARKARERKEMKQPGMHICVISSWAAWLPYETKWCCTAFHVGPCLQERWLQTKYNPMLPKSG